MVLPAWLARGLAFDRAGLHPAAAARAGLGVVVPLVIGTSVGHPAEGAQAAAGALPAGVAAMTGAFGPPTGLMLATTAGMTLSTFVGSLVAGHTAAMVATLAVWGFVAGLMVTLGRAATIVGVQAVVGFVVFGRYAGGVAASGTHAAWVLAGGLMQLLLAHLLRTPRRFGRERRAVAAAYDALASLARTVLDGAPGAPAAEAVATAGAVVARRTDDDSAGLDELRGLVDEGSRMRLELQALTSVPETAALRRLTTASAVWLSAIAESVRGGEPPGGESPDVALMVDELRQGGATSAERFTAARTSALLGQLREGQRLATALSGVRRLPLPHVGGLRPTVDLASRTRSTMRRLWSAAADPRTPEMRHAVRLGVLLTVSALVADVLPWQRGWWVILTTVVVLKPDYAATMQRGVARVLGTAAGVVVAGALVGSAHPRALALVGLVGVFAWGSYTVFSASYAVYTFMLTGVVVLLLSTFDPRPLSAVADRGLDTIIGGTIALVGYALWPTLESPTLRATTLGLLDALAAYADAVLTAYAEPGAVEADQLAAAGRAARRARAEAQASIERASAEPARLRPDTTTAVSVLASARRIVLTLHSLRATVQDSSEPVAVPELLPMRADIVEALRALARGKVSTNGLRESQQRLKDVADHDDIATWHGRRLALAAAYLDPLVDGVDTIEHVMSGAATSSSQALSVRTGSQPVNHP